MITISKLTVGYSKERNVLDALDLTIHEGTIAGIVGLNGSGKTTLFNAIFGLKSIQQGAVLYDNQPVTKRDMVYLPAENFFYSNITGREYLMLFRNPVFETDQWNELFTLPLDQIIDSYSTGMKKKLAILGVIKQNRPIVLLDEPFNGLDIEMCRILRLALLKLKAGGKTIIVSSHVLETLTNLCDSIHYIEAGKIKYNIPKDNFASFEKEVFALIEKDNTKIIDKLVV